MLQDPRVIKVAKQLVHQSLKVQRNEHVLVRFSSESKSLVCAIIAELYACGAYAHTQQYDDEVKQALLSGMRVEQAEVDVKSQMALYEGMDATILIIAEQNDCEFAEIPASIFSEYSQIMRPASDYVVKQLRWVLLNWPTPAAAQKAGMSLAAYADYVFAVSSVDYAKMSVAMKSLKQLMEQTDRVRITSPGTDLRFSIKDIPAIPCAGECNIPDGEVFTAPVKDSVEGTIRYNTPCPYRGKVFHDVTLTFEAGKIVEATADDTLGLNEILDTDEGARYIGEFAIGVNPLITRPMGDILFDEKITGSLHVTPGAAYEDEADNGNRSSVHWDLVLIQTPEYGGGEIYFDDVLIRRDGRFVLPELESLNPENLQTTAEN
ncbi:MAG: aminopeptidase [Culicoidibacterales bacterium]